MVTKDELLKIAGQVMTEEYAAAVIHVVTTEHVGREKVAMEACVKLVQARAARTMSGRSYASRLFQEFNSYEQKHNFYDAMEILDMADLIVT